VQRPGPRRWSTASARPPDRPRRQYAVLAQAVLETLQARRQQALRGGTHTRVLRRHALCLAQGIVGTAPGRIQEVAAGFGLFQAGEQAQQRPFALRTRHRRGLQRRLGTARLLDGVPGRLQRARGRTQRLGRLHGLGGFVETEISRQPRRTRELRIGHLQLTTAGGRIVGQRGKHRSERLRRDIQFLPAQRGVAFALAALQCVVQYFLGGRQIDMPGIVATGAAHKRRCPGDITASGRCTRLLQQVGKRILAPFQRTHLVGRQRQHLLEQRQRTVRAAIKPLRLQGRFRAAQQRADSRARLVMGVQLL